MQIAVLEMTVRKPSFDNFNNADTEYTAAYLGLISWTDFLDQSWPDKTTSIRPRSPRLGPYHIIFYTMMPLIVIRGKPYCHDKASTDFVQHMDGPSDGLDCVLCPSSCTYGIF